MNQVTRTVAFVAIAGASVGIAAVAHYVSRSKPTEGFEKVGQEFYPEFKFPNQATGLRVVAYNDKTATADEFKVEFKDGLWRIPSHFNYPADAKDQLAKTAASVIGIKRGRLQSRRKADQKRFGVIDPLDETNPSLKGRGQRVTLTAKDGSILCDYIIGKKVEGRENVYYVRVPDENETYLATLKIDLSTKFGDWIEPDLLQLDANTLTKVIVHKYSIDAAKRALVGQEISELDRKTSSDPWKLKGLNEKTEQLNDENIRELTSRLDNLRIEGVRPKPRGLRADLSIDPKFVQNQGDFDALRLDMQSKGFLLVPDESRQIQLISHEGKVLAGTNDGVLYVLNFGDVFTGSPFEIEFGGTATTKTDGKSKSKSPAGKKDKKTKDQKKGRYLFVTVRFSSDLLGEKPTEPVKPKKPAGLDEKKTAKKTTGDKTTGGGKKKKTDKSAKPAGDAKPKSGTQTPGDKPPAAKKKDPAAEYKQAMAAYNTALAKYKADLKAYNDKLDKGRKKVDELNERFAGWYYVISGESFENLRLARKDLVKPKKKDKTGEPGKTTSPASPQTPVTAPKPPSTSKKAAKSAPGTPTSKTTKSDPKKKDKQKPSSSASSKPSAGKKTPGKK